MAAEGFGLSAHWIFETLAYLVGFWLYRRDRRDSGDFLSNSGRFTIIAASVVGAAVGSKLLNWLEDPAAALAHPIQFLLSGKTIVGGLLGGTMAVEWVKSRTGVRRRTGDLFAFPLAIAIAVGRIGCFLGGLTDGTFGVKTSLPWGVDFGDGTPRHPTQLYEILFLILLAVWIKHRSSIRHREGDLFRAFLVFYLIFRFAVDFLKPGVQFAGLTAIQWACAIAILAYWRDIPFLLAPWKGARQSDSEFGPTSFTTPPRPSAPSATGALTERSSSRTTASTS